MNSLRARLPRTFATFLGRFPRPTEIQQRGIPPILDGRDVLLCAPTASGKTEAYITPLVERIPTRNRRRPLQVIVVSPTRALANDLKRRLEVRMDDAAVTFGRFTGEHKERHGGQLPAVAVATPEALDSLLARRASLLDELRAVVIDEIHVLDGTSRGDQLRLLLERIDRRRQGQTLGHASRDSVQTVAVSATVSDPQRLAKRYLRDAEIIAVADHREIRGRAFDGSSPEELAPHLCALATAGLRKVLIFCNSRSRVERVASHLRGRTPFGDKVFPHHGSLARALRERTERQILDAPAAVCVSTMTMELGIDIGTVDYVLLADVPSSVSSLMQRMGRGSRRAGKLRVGYACATEGERIVLRVLCQRAAAGDLCENPYAFRPGVLVQQALVIAGSQEWVTVEQLVDLVPAAIRDELPPDTVVEIFRILEKAEILEAHGRGRYVLSESMDQRYRRGVLHSNLDNDAEITVIDRLTGDTIGSVATGQTDKPRLNLGGAARRLAHSDARRIYTDADRKGRAARFPTRGKPSISLPLARAVAEELGVPPHCIAQRRNSEGGFIVCHGLGSSGAPLLAHCLEIQGQAGRVQHVTPYTLRTEKAITALPDPDASAVRAVATGREKELARSATLGPYHRYLPEKLQHLTLRQTSGLDHAANWLRNANFAQPSEEPAPRSWEVV